MFSELSRSLRTIAQSGLMLRSPQPADSFPRLTKLNRQLLANSRRDCQLVLHREYHVLELPALALNRKRDIWAKYRPTGLTPSVSTPS
jgi:hypothetical protein